MFVDLGLVVVRVVCCFLGQRTYERHASAVRDMHTGHAYGVMPVSIIPPSPLPMSSQT